MSEGGSETEDPAPTAPSQRNPTSRGHSPKVGDLVTRDPVAVAPGTALRDAAWLMNDNHVGSAIVINGDGALAGIVTERDLLRAVATHVDFDTQTVDELMTVDVIRAGPDWEVYEAAAEMSDRGIRHLVVGTADRVDGVVSIRDLLLSGQRIELTGSSWVVLRDPLTFSVRERRRLQRALLNLEGGASPNVDGLIHELVGSWSFDLPLPADAATLAQLDDKDHELLHAAVLDELPHLQRAVQPAPGWRHWRHSS